MDLWLRRLPPEERAAGVPSPDVRSSGDEATEGAGAQRQADEPSGVAENRPAKRGRPRKDRPSYLRAVPDRPRDELHHARVIDLQDEVHRLAKLNLADAMYEDEPGPRGVLASAGVKLAGAYLQLMNAEHVLRERLATGGE